ncbi:MAG: zf-TFIIB domain-containing protein [Deltaproteobacteria bacterium]|nr:zf-TFIIB domain-containing protein [Deltaproteobacteria bacterium]
MLPVCPSCDHALCILELHGVASDYCYECQGLWLDAGELESLLTATGAGIDDPLLHAHELPATKPRGRKRLCPRCDQRLLPIQPTAADGRHVTLDRCPHGHGLWFDAGELTQLLALFPETSGAGKTIAYLQDLLGKSVTAELGRTL